VEIAAGWLASGVVRNWPGQGAGWPDMPRSTPYLKSPYTFPVCGDFRTRCGSLRFVRGRNCVLSGL